MRCRIFASILFASFVYLFLVAAAGSVYAVCQDYQNSCDSCSCDGSGCNQTCSGVEYGPAPDFEPSFCTISQSCNMPSQRVVDSCDCSDTRSDTDSTTWTFNRVSCTNGSVCQGPIGRGGTGCHYCVTASNVCNNNGARDNGETGVDCGGGNCANCPVTAVGCGESPCGMCEQKMSDGSCQTANNICCRRKCFGNGCWTTAEGGADECGPPEGPGSCTVPPKEGCSPGMLCGSNADCGGGWCKSCNPPGRPPDPATCPAPGGRCEKCAPDPPPPPPPPPGKPWIKVKNTSVYAYTDLYSPMHRIPDAYDTEDTDTSRKFNIGDAGIVAARNLIRLDDMKSGTEVSTPKWMREEYYMDKKVDVTQIIEYSKARKNYKEITAIDQITEDNTIYIWTGPNTLELTQPDMAQLNGKNIVIVVDGLIVFNVASKKINTNSSIAYIAKAISFYKDATLIDEANGIFLANLVLTGPRTGISVPGLKIKGNLGGGSTLMRRRQNGDNRRPSLFIVFDPTPFVELLPLLSTTGYDWRQIQ